MMVPIAPRPRGFVGNAAYHRHQSAGFYNMQMIRVHFHARVVKTSHSTYNACTMPIFKCRIKPERDKLFIFFSHEPWPMQHDGKMYRIWRRGQMSQNDQTQ